VPTADAQAELFFDLVYVFASTQLSGQELLSALVNEVSAPTPVEPIAFLFDHVAERRGHAAAGCRDHGKASRDHRSRCGHVPGVRKQERGAGAVQRPQQVALTLAVGCRRGRNEKTLLDTLVPDEAVQNLPLLSYDGRTQIAGVARMAAYPLERGRSHHAASARLPARHSAPG